MKYNNVRKIINNILFETHYNIRSEESFRAGQFAHHQSKKEDPKPELPKELPLQPDSSMGLNSIMTRPPVEDDEYVPKTPSDLAAAVKALSELMGNQEVADIYAQIKDIMKSGGEPDTVTEAYSDDFGNFEDFPDDSDMPEEFRSGYSVEEPEDSGEDDQKFKSSKSSGEASLSDLAKSGLIPGVSGESGVKQYLGRAGKKMAAVQQLPKGEVDKAKKYARDIWVGALAATESISPEEAEALKKSDYTLTNSAFLSFFNMGFLEPALKPLRNQRDRDAKKEISTLGFPVQLETTVFNQLIGNSPANERKIRIKLNKIEPDMNFEESDNLVKKAISYIRSNTEKYQKDFMKNVDFLGAVKDAWSKKSTKDKMDITYAAIDDAEDFQKSAQKAGIR